MTHTCGRRAESGMDVEGSPFRGAGKNLDSYREDGTCSYCGSLDPAILFARLEAGDVELGPTDKNYKVYVNNRGGAPFKQTYRDCYEKDEQGRMKFKTVEGGQRIAAIKEPVCHGPDDCKHWVTREIDHAKFYFQHLDDAGKERFVQMLNDKKLNIGYPGYFYRMPYFVRVLPDDPSNAAPGARSEG